MDFSALKANLRFRSGRTKQNSSKRFPTKDVPRIYKPSKSLDEEQQEKPREIQLTKPKRKKSAQPEPFDEDLAHIERVEHLAETQAKLEGGGISPTTSAAEAVIETEPTVENLDLEHKGLERASPAEDQILHSQPDSQQQYLDAPTQVTSMAETNPQPEIHSSGEDFDLRPSIAAPKPHSPSIETLSELLYSEGYLDTITSDPILLSRFTSFLNRYRPGATSLVRRYIETQKVTKALEYANAVAATLDDKRTHAAELSPAFREDSQKVYATLLRDALPAWVTYSLVKTSTACLTAEITNASTPLTRDLVGGLSEVFCITDPTQEDNPIVYSSQEFYRLTGYDKDNVIGYNCRFLQGQRTLKESVIRLKDAIGEGKEICEVLLNYRRNGTPFINVLMLAPLHDDKGRVRYYLGAQVDASRLVEEGRGLEGFERYLVRREMNVERGRRGGDNLKKNALSKLRDLSMTFDLEESAVVKSNSRNSSMTRDGRSGSVGSTDRGSHTARRVLQDEDDEGSSGDESGEENKRDSAWRLSQGSLASGSLPGIYQQYLLIRPYPSLRIVFVSRAMKKYGRLQQRPFLAHVCAPQSTLTGLTESFESSTPVTAKIALASEGGKRDGTVTGRWGRKSTDDPAKYGRTCYISATPLLDGNNRVGVWMVVIADKASIASQAGYAAELNQALKTEKYSADVEASPRTESNEQKDLPIKPKRVGSFERGEENAMPARTNNEINEHMPNGSVSQNDKPNGNTVEEDAKNLADSGYGHLFTNQQDGLTHNEEHNSRSASTAPDSEERDEGPTKTEADNKPPAAESMNGLASPKIEVETSQTEDLPTPTRANFDNSDSEKTPTRPQQQGGHSARPSMLGMDYLNARSPKQSRPHGGKSLNESDWPCRSPYSVD
ncbi:MAG: hypothetical protein Q9160_007284 [Pyrenula sp. 1 TL-2023]